MAVFYVAPETGNDDNDGLSAESPKLTWGAVLALGEAGDTYLGKGGEIATEIVIPAAANQTIGSYGTGRTIIDAEDARDFCVDVNAVDGIIINYVLCQGALDSGIRFRLGADNGEVRSCIILDCDGGEFSRGVYFSGGTGGKILNTAIFDIADDCVHFAANHGGKGLISGCFFTRFGGDAAQKVFAASNYAELNLLVERNVSIKTNSTKGHFVVPAPCTIQDNILTYTGESDTIGITVGMYGGNTATITRNLVHKHSTGINVNPSDVAEINGVLDIFSNQFRNAQSSGTAKDVFVDIGSGSGVNAANSVKIRNNLFTSGEAAVWMSIDVKDLKISNNAFVSMANPRIRSNVAQTAIDSDNNHFDAEASLMLHYNGTSYATVAAWNAATGQDGSSNVGNLSIKSNGVPNFDSSAVADGEISIDIDYFGNRFYILPTIGACEVYHNKSFGAVTAAALPVRVLPAGVDIAKARAV